MRSDLIAIEARDATGEIYSLRTYELPDGLSDDEELAQVDSLVRFVHPAAAREATGPDRVYLEAGRTITVRAVVPPQSSTEQDQDRLFAA